MIEHSVLFDGAGITVRERRGLPGVSQWVERGTVAASNLEQLSAWSAARAGWRLGVRIYVGSSICRILTLRNVPRLRSLKEYEAIAAHAFTHRLGLAAGEWTVRVDPASRAGVIACAMRKETVRSAVDIASRLGQPLRSLDPWAALTLSHAGDDRSRTATFVEERGALLACVPDATGLELRTLPIASMAGLGPVLAAFGLTDAAERESKRMRLVDAAKATPRGDFLDLLEPVA